MKRLFLLFVLIFLINSQCFAQTVYDDNYVENPNYVQGSKYLANSQYSSAINEFKKAIRVNPNDSSALIGLANAYMSALKNPFVKVNLQYICSELDKIMNA